MRSSRCVSLLFSLLFCSFSYFYKPNTPILYCSQSVLIFNSRPRFKSWAQYFNSRVRAGLRLQKQVPVLHLNSRPSSGPETEFQTSTFTNQNLALAEHKIAIKYLYTGTQLKLKIHTKHTPSTLIVLLRTKLKFMFSEDLSAPILALELLVSPSSTPNRNATAHFSLDLVDFGTQSYIFA